MTTKTTGPKNVSFRPGSAIFHEGEVSNSFFLIKKGTVAVRKTKGSDQVEIARLYSNEIFGEVSFFDRAPRSATMVALTEVDVVEIGFDALEGVYAKLPDYLKTIMASMAERLRRADDMIRRLQHDVIHEGGGASDEKGKLSAADVLAALEVAHHTETPV